VFYDAVGWLRARSVLLPGVTTLARLVARVREEEANQRLWDTLAGLPTAVQRRRLADLLEVPAGARISDLERWRKGGVEPLVVQPQPEGDLPGDIAPQRADRLPVRQALQGLQDHHRGDHLGGHRGMPATLAGDIGEQLGREQRMAVVGEEGVHRPLGDQVAAPGRRVQLVIGWVACGRHAGQFARSRPPARTTGSTRATGSNEPRPSAGS